MVRRIAVIAALVIAIGGGAAYAMRVPLFFGAMRLLGPSHAFDLARKAEPPDYARPDAWLALPETRDLADLGPARPESERGTGERSAPARPASSPLGSDGLPGVALGRSAGPRVAAFFVHPTTYMRAEDWNDPMRTGTSTEENTRWVLANQASAFNDCCDVYAPRYRQASLFAFFRSPDDPVANAALDFAYGDVERAFDAFLERIGEGAPFLLASHSQGSFHLHRLLRERISETPLRERMVAAYLIGADVTRAHLDAIPDVRACETATDLGCVIHWATYGPNGEARGETLCTNPLSWTTDGAPAAASANLGAVVPSGSFEMAFRGEDRALGISFEPLGAPLPAYTGAECRDGLLIVDAQEDSPFARYAALGGQNYHGLDYALFYMNIRANARARAEAYLARGAP